MTEQPLVVAAPCSSAALPLAREILAQLTQAPSASVLPSALRQLQAHGTGEFFALSMRSAESALEPGAPYDARK